MLRSTENDPVPTVVGIGLRSIHYQEILSSLPALGWMEVHSENYFGDGGQPLYNLEQIAAHYPLSLHGVGLSLGSADPLNTTHLRKLKSLIERFDPFLVSEHLCWGAVDGLYLNDLLPLPYTREALEHIVIRITEAQQFLGRQLLIENVSSYLQFKQSTIPEWEFIAEVASRSGCALLVDVNNIYVNSINHGFDAGRYLNCLPTESVKEIHLAGFDDNGRCLIDTHGKPVAAPVWELYKNALTRFGEIPTLIEWDTDIPALAVLLTEAEKAKLILKEKLHGNVTRIAANIFA